MYIVYFKLVILRTYSLYGYREYSTMFTLNVYFHYVYIGNLQHSMFNTCNTPQTWSGVWAQVNCFIQINITINGNISIGCWFLNNVGQITHQAEQTHYQMLFFCIMYMFHTLYFPLYSQWIHHHMEAVGNRPENQDHCKFWYQWNRRWRHTFWCYSALIRVGVFEHSVSF